MTITEDLGGQTSTNVLYVAISPLQPPQIKGFDHFCKHYPVPSFVFICNVVDPGKPNAINKNNLGNDELI